MTLYPDNIEQKIDFTAIRQRLKNHCAFSMAREHCDSMAFLTDPEAIQRLLAEAREMMDILADASLAYPQCEMHDLREALSRIRIDGLFLDEDELARLRVALDAVVQYIAFFRALPSERFPLLSQWHPLPPSPYGDFPSTENTPAPHRGDLARSDAPAALSSSKESGGGSSAFSFLLREIDRILDKYGQLRDNASPELARIRRELRLAQGSVNRALQSILRQAQSDGIIDRDVTPTLREGRLVIPVPPAYKRKIGGIVHDESATGKTVYVEPQQVVEANNHIRELEGDERRERTRILREFADLLRPHVPAIRSSQLFLADIDFLHAKALLSRELKAISPDILPFPYIDLREARHPILYLHFLRQNRTLVPLTLRLGSRDQSPQPHILVISGPNAGGKSVCLKTVALLQYMLQCGLPVPVREDSVMGVFRDILIDIGDEQSIEDDLSTYSSHLRNMKQFVRTASDRSLFLIDEFGGGTEPLLGGAIAEAILQQLSSVGAFGVITTHYTNLKHFADTHPSVINGAMLYDRGALRPLFQLSVGQPGSSFAIEIARQIGLPEDIIAAATALVGEENIQYDRSLQDIQRDKRYWAEKRKKIHLQEKRLQELTDQYEAEMATIRQQRRDVLLKAKEEAADILRKSNAEIERTIRVIQETKAAKEATRAARARVASLKDSLSSDSDDRYSDAPASSSPYCDFPSTENTPAPRRGDLARSGSPSSSSSPSNRPSSPSLSVGVSVRIKGQSAIGEVIAISGKQATVAFGLMKSQVAINRLEVLSRSQAKKAAAPSPHLTPMASPYSSIADSLRKKKMSFSDELDIRGFRADDALQEVMSYIDDAIMVGASQVRILHGTGGGVLKFLVRDYLRLQPRVVSFHDGDPDRGGAGLTIVEFE